MSKVEEAKKQKRNKKKKRLLFRSIILLALLAALIFALISNFNNDEASLGVGDQAPPFQLKQLNGDAETLNLADLEGKGIMLNFWATYCKPCEDEMPYMQSLYPKYKDDIEIVAVSVDATQLVIDRFVDNYNLTFPILHDNKEQVMDLYNVGPLPTTYFINPDGEIVEVVSGPLTLERLDGYLQQILPE
ncbi:thiol-disulfide oxidoreductase ResA [Aquibacillus rhizosphaerae]|uniref:Thiol-disulfide oxidoreductase ResA n=1 Tax=Aquibacillus rhizosphaerae TaxID=3051431 RepID=A0ABT7L6A4_9BACI|nr:thiol-disulfide oxidoreductase ResA [Aquibacillus sp. LR5S19]MDL4840757.1 thiol-disulfide oxidoreductase ResA [Aquibacillus sp. LR5S19]